MSDKTPRTEAGKRLEAEWLRNLRGGSAPVDFPRRAILALEAEAAALDRETLREAARLVSFAADRLVHVYGESDNVDFILALRNLALKLQEDS
jgi:hypothetical protein